MTRTLTFFSADGTTTSFGARLLNPRDGCKVVLSAEAVHHLNMMAGRSPYVLTTDEHTVTREMAQMLTEQVTVDYLTEDVRGTKRK